MSTLNFESQVRLWLEVALSERNIKKPSNIQILDQSGKGDGFSGEVHFVLVTAEEKGSKNDYNLVLKCNKSENNYKKSWIGPAYDNEIHFYKNVLPTFQKFQFDKNVDDIFNSVPQYYGSFDSTNKKVLVLENLKNKGYAVWNHEKPWNRPQIDFVISEYAKFHAISVAMREQRKDIFEKLTSNSDEVEEFFGKIFERNESIQAFAQIVEETYHLLKDDFGDELLKLLTYKTELDFILGRGMRELMKNHFKVIVHGDCWNNNFMHSNGKVAIIDWQLSKLASPIPDLSIFLFANISEQDLDDLDTILQLYYDSFCKNLEKLGERSHSKIYPRAEFLDDWKRFCKIGLTFAIGSAKIAFAEKADLKEVASDDNGEANLDGFFAFRIKNVEGFKNKIRPVVKYFLEKIL